MVLTNNDPATQYQMSVYIFTAF